MEWKIIAIIVGVLSSAIVGIYGLMYKHATRGNKHPCAENLVYEDTCEARRDCIESSVKDLKEYSKERFDRIEDLIKDARS